MKKQKQLNGLKIVTIAFGYSLFALSLVATTVSTIIPFSALYLSPTVRHFNVAIILISLVASAVLPPLISYIIGDRAIHTNNKVSHHFNGILFGIAAYWISLFLSYVMSESIQTVRNNFAEPLATIINGWPIVATIGIMGLLAFVYAHHQKRNSTLLEYKPFQATLVCGVFALNIYTLINQYLRADSNVMISLLSIAVPVALIALAYKLVSKHSTVSTRLTIALVAMSIGYITSTIAAQLMTDPSVNMFVPISIGLLSFAAYLILIRRY